MALLLGQSSAELSTLQALDRRLVDTELELRELDARASRLGRELSTLNVSLAEARLRLADAEAALGKRLRAMARQPHAAALLLLGDSASLPDFLRGRRTLRWLARADRTLRNELEQQADALATTVAELTRKRNALAEVEYALHERREALAAERRERVELLARLARNPEGLASQQRAARRELDSALTHLDAQSSSPASVATSRGRLPWPANGAVGAAFGTRLPTNDGRGVQRGWDIRAPYGSRVQSVAAGAVAYAGWISGYGQIVIVEHGADYHTIYAHLASLACTQGDPVTAGQTLGTVGDTGSTRGTVLYFEIRHRGEPLDPKAWLRP